MKFLDERLPMRFWDKVQPCPMSGCWIWTGGISKQYRHGRGSGGYGRFTVDGKYVPAHRHAYSTLVTPVPVGLDTDHLCRVRCCVNPLHLEPVTRAENIRRGEWDPQKASALALPGRARRTASITHCLRGHEFVEENMYRDGNRRICKACSRERYLRIRATRAGVEA